MKNFNYLCIALFILTAWFLNGCNENSNEEWALVASYYPNKVLAEKYYIKNDSIEGMYLSFYEDGSKKVQCFYKDNKYDSLYKSFYNNGVLEDSLHFTNGKLFGEQFYFHRNGALRRYNVYDMFGNNMYVLKYDSLNVETKREGVVISPIVYCSVCKEGFIEVGEEATINLVGSKPPAVSLEVYFIEISNPRDSLKHEKLPVVEHNVVPLFLPFNDKGIYEFYFLGLHMDEKGATIARDSLYYRVEVIDKSSAVQNKTL